jgi:nucleoside-diphosphate-sugar epimerase
VDLADAGQVYGVLAGADAVIHLGAYPNEAHHPGERVYVNNTAACANVAAACIAYGIKRVVYTSSITIYSLDVQARRGGITRLPVDESLGALPDSWYPLSKWAGEGIFSMAAEAHGLQVASLRPALVIGPDEYESRGRPRQDRDASGGLWGYVDSRDVAQMARLALERLDTLGAGNHAFNCGAADAHSAEPLCDVIPRFIPELTEQAKALTGTTPAFSIEKAQRLLGYEPRYSWRDALAG